MHILDENINGAIFHFSKAFGLNSDELNMKKNAPKENERIFFSATSILSVYVAILIILTLKVI